MRSAYAYRTDKTRLQRKRRIKFYIIESPVYVRNESGSDFRHAAYFFVNRNSLGNNRTSSLFGSISPNIEIHKICAVTGTCRTERIFPCIYGNFEVIHRFVYNSRRGYPRGIKHNFVSLRLRIALRKSSVGILINISSAAFAVYKRDLLNCLYPGSAALNYMVQRKEIHFVSVISPCKKVYISFSLKMKVYTVSRHGIIVMVFAIYLSIRRIINVLSVYGRIHKVHSVNIISAAKKYVSHILTSSAVRIPVFLQAEFGYGLFAIATKVTTHTAVCAVKIVGYPYKAVRLARASQHFQCAIVVRRCVVKRRANIAYRILSKSYITVSVIPTTCNVSCIVIGYGIIIVYV